MKEIEHGMLNEEPGGYESETRVLAVKSIVIGVESEMIKKEKA
jgi:hypothetical protein